MNVVCRLEKVLASRFMYSTSVMTKSQSGQAPHIVQPGSVKAADGPGAHEEDVDWPGNTVGKASSCHCIAKLGFSNHLSAVGSQAAAVAIVARRLLRPDSENSKLPVSISRATEMVLAEKYD